MMQSMCCFLLLTEAIQNVCQVHWYQNLKVCIGMSVKKLTATAQTQLHRAVFLCADFAAALNLQIVTRKAEV